MDNLGRGARPTGASSNQTTQDSAPQPLMSVESL